MTARDWTAGLLAAVIAGVAAAEVAAPFTDTLHAWWFALGITIAGAYLLWVGLAWAVRRTGSGPLAVAALGGSLLAACVAFAAFLVGQPQRVPEAPGQSYRPPHGSGVAVTFPEVTVPAKIGAVPSQWPDGIGIDSASGRALAHPGDTVRTDAFVFRVTSGPIAYVDARGERGQPVTVTQKDSPAFMSPFLMFEGFDGDQPAGLFEVPALHRTVQVDYWAGLPSRGIDVPFVALRIAEENGGPLFEGVAVSGRPLRKAGVVLTFALGTYPVVTASSAPPLVPFWAGVAMVVAGLVAAGVRSAGRRAGARR